MVKIATHTRDGTGGAIKIVYRDAPKLYYYSLCDIGVYANSLGHLNAYLFEMFSAKNHVLLRTANIG